MPVPPSLPRRAGHRAVEATGKVEAMTEPTAAPVPFDPDWVVPTSDFLRDWMEENGVTSPRILAAMCAPLDVRDHVADRLRAVLDDDAELTDGLADMLARATR